MQVSLQKLYSDFNGSLYLQLSNELCNGHVFEGWKEGLVNFPPTYKYEYNSDKYAGEFTQDAEKKRSPAW